MLVLVMGYEFKVGDHAIPKNPDNSFLIDYIHILDMDKEGCRVMCKLLDSDIIQSGWVYLNDLYEYFKPLIKEPVFPIEEI